MKRLIVVSGAGLSVDSGIRAFRVDTKSGRSLWDEYDLEEVCNIHSFRIGYEYLQTGLNGSSSTDDDGLDFYHKTHDFYNKRRVELQTVYPNIAHLRVAEWYNRFSGRVINITTNVDDLLERAGVPKDEVLHVHGYLKEVVIENESGSPKKVIDVGYNEIDPEEYGWCKPNVIFFGETAPLYSEMYSILYDLTVQDMVIVVGCSNQVIDFNWELFPAARRGTKVCVVNPDVNYLEQQLYEEAGVTVWRAGAAEVFGNPHFISYVENYMES